jgi:hypothetical protein
MKDFPQKLAPNGAHIIQDGVRHILTKFVDQPVNDLLRGLGNVSFSTTWTSSKVISLSLASSSPSASPKLFEITLLQSFLSRC